MGLFALKWFPCITSKFSFELLFMHVAKAKCHAMHLRKPEPGLQLREYQAAVHKRAMRVRMQPTTGLPTTPRSSKFRGAFAFTVSDRANPQAPADIRAFPDGAMYPTISPRGEIMLAVLLNCACGLHICLCFACV